VTVPRRLCFCFARPQWPWILLVLSDSGGAPARSGMQIASKLQAGGVSQIQFLSRAPCMVWCCQATPRGVTFTGFWNGQGAGTGVSRRSGEFHGGDRRRKRPKSAGWFAHRPIAIIYYRDNKQSIIHDVQKRIRVLHNDVAIQ
jgi:hypothetical protein